MLIDKPEKFPIEFTDEENIVFDDAICMLKKIIHQLEDNDLTTIQNSSEGICLELEDIREMLDTLIDFCKMDEAF